MRFDKPKGQRMHRYFVGITNFSGMWWLEKSRKWVETLPFPLKECASTTAPCRTLRAFLRHLRKNPSIHGNAILVSRCRGFCIYA